MRLKQQFHSIIKLNVDSVIDQYIRDCQSRNLSPKTVGIYAFHLAWFTKFLVECSITELDHINSTVVREYMRSIQIPGRSPETVHCSYRVVRTFLRFCIADDLISESVLRGIKAPKLPKKIMPALTELEVREVISFLSIWDETRPADRTLDHLFSLRNLALFLFMLDSGVRVTEASNIKMKHIDLSSGRVFVEEGKGSKDRVTFVSERTCKEIRKYIRFTGIHDSSELWLGQTGPLTSQGIQTVFRQISLKRGITVNPHKIRRTFAVMMLRNGADLYRLKELMGHSDIRTLERYLAISEGDIQSSHIAASPISNLKNSCDRYDVNVCPSGMANTIQMALKHP